MSMPGCTTSTKISPAKVTNDGTTHSIGIAGIQVVHAPDKIRTVLGSCIGIALYDRVGKIGGLAHVILPCSKEGRGDPGKFADSAVDLLLEKLVEAGAERKRITAKITGGAAMFGDSLSKGLGQRNMDAVKDRLLHHAIRLAAVDIGGTKGRKMLLNPANGEVEVIIIGQPSRTI